MPPPFKWSSGKKRKSKKRVTISKPMPHQAAVNQTQGIVKEQTI